MEESDNANIVNLYHVKRMTAANHNSSVDDIYEVFGQAVKSTIWLQSPSTLLSRMTQRRKSGKCRFLRGSYEDFERDIERQRLLRGRIVVVQPSISQGVEMPQKFQAVLGAARYYITNLGKVNEFRIWGS